MDRAGGRTTFLLTWKAPLPPRGQARFIGMSALPRVLNLLTRRAIPPAVGLNLIPIALHFPVTRHPPLPAKLFIMTQHLYTRPNRPLTSSRGRPPPLKAPGLTAIGLYPYARLAIPPPELQAKTRTRGLELPTANGLTHSKYLLEGMIRSKREFTERRHPLQL